jgi:LPS sulfotransferase NodH
MYRKTMPGAVLQEIDWDAIDAWIVSAYQKQMKKYLAERDLIPEGHLVEIRYEDLDAEPIAHMEKIYSTLELGDFAAVRPILENYLDSLGSYQKNKFDFPPEVISTVNENWGFAFDAFGYERQEAS